MRTPNTQCAICSKPLYRRPSDMVKHEGACCIGCRSEYYKKKEVSPNLKLGRQKGTNNLTGIPKSQTHRQKIKKIITDWCATNTDKVKERGEKTRGENHYQWKGGITRVNNSIRRMTENRKWAQAVKERDGFCLFCGSTKELEADHINPLAVIVSEHRVKNRTDARNCPELWDISNGRTLCKKCHCEKDGRKYNANGNGRRQK